MSRQRWQHIVVDHRALWLSLIVFTYLHVLIVNNDMIRRSVHLTQTTHRHHKLIFYVYETVRATIFSAIEVTFCRSFVFTDNLSSPDRALDRLCVSVCAYNDVCKTWTTSYVTECTVICVHTIFSHSTIASLPRPAGIQPSQKLLLPQFVSILNSL